MWYIYYLCEEKTEETVSNGQSRNTDNKAKNEDKQQQQQKWQTNKKTKQNGQGKLSS